INLTRRLVNWIYAYRLGIRLHQVQVVTEPSLNNSHTWLLSFTMPRSPGCKLRTKRCSQCRKDKQLVRPSELAFYVPNVMDMLTKNPRTVIQNIQTVLRESVASVASDTIPIAQIIIMLKRILNTPLH